MSVFKSTLFVAMLVLQATQAEHVNARGVRHGGKPSSGFLKIAADQQRFRDELHQAVYDVLGLDHGLDLAHLDGVRKELVPMWESLAKNAYGGVDRRSLRYAVHRYFMKVHSISVIGLEPLKHQGSTNDDALLVMDFAPKYVKQLLHEGDEQQQGYSINDAVAMIAMLRQLVTHHSADKLQALFMDRRWSFEASFSRNFTAKALEGYLIRWLIGNDNELLRMLDGNPEALERDFEHYHEFVSFANGLVQTFEHQGWRQPAGAWYNAPSSSPLREGFSFEDVRSMASEMVLSFGSYWHTECMRIKEMLVEMDHGAIGRIKLSDFHGAALGGEWRFSESKEYLRTIGALDETSSAHGPRVILANYVQGVSNCIASDDHYRVCCPSECEGYMAEIEANVKGPYATPEQLLSIIGPMTTSLDDTSPAITPAMQSQLRDIASTHHGTVPLHARLFAQWLHYVFPQDCPFPHKAGDARSVAIHQYGRDYMASRAEMAEHVQDAVVRASATNSSDETQWMTQWSEEEELLSQHIHLHAPWEQRLSPLSSTLSLATVLSAAGLVVTGVRRIMVDSKGQGEIGCMKHHFV